MMSIDNWDQGHSGTGVGASEGKGAKALFFREALIQPHRPQNEETSTSPRLFFPWTALAG
jgi:hypothetical protein